MGNKILGVAVWKGVKWYLRRRYGDRPRKIFAGTVVGLVLAAGIVAALRQRGE
jgi:hypothetical protein